MLHLADAFAVFREQDSGCLSYGVERGGRRWFVKTGPGLPGSTRYMAPEEFTRGATVDERTTVHVLGRTGQHLLDSPAGWRGDAAQAEVLQRATRPDPADRFPTVAALLAAWRAAWVPADPPSDPRG
jgi:hypothetical protein